MAHTVIFINQLQDRKPAPRGVWQKECMGSVQGKLLLQMRSSWTGICRYVKNGRVRKTGKAWEHLSTWRHSRDRCSQVFPIFCALPLQNTDILNTNQRAKKNEGGHAGTRLRVYNHQDNCSQPIDYHLTVRRSGHNTKVMSKLATCKDIYTSGCGFLFNSASLFVIRFTTYCTAQQRLPST